MESPGQRMCWAVWAELHQAMGEPSVALEVVDRLIASTGPGVAPRLWQIRGEALVALGRAGDGVDVLRPAVVESARLGLRGREWRIQASLARALRAVGRRDEADQALGVARSTLHDLALEIDDPRLRDTFVRETSSLVPPAPSPTPARAAKAKFGGLTAREREVARLIARGLSNRAIAEHLVLGERTVESYVGNVLSKLNFTSRAQIAAWAVESGLTGDSPSR